MKRFLLNLDFFESWKESFQFWGFVFLVIFGYFIYLLTVRSKTSFILNLFFPSITLYITNLSHLPVTTLPNVSSKMLCRAMPTREALIFYPFAIAHCSGGFFPHPPRNVHPPHPASPRIPVLGSVDSLSFQHRSLSHPAQYHTCRT